MVTMYILLGSKSPPNLDKTIDFKLKYSINDLKQKTKKKEKKKKEKSSLVQVGTWDVDLLWQPLGWV